MYGSTANYVSPKEIPVDLTQSQKSFIVIDSISESWTCLLIRFALNSK